MPTFHKLQVAGIDRLTPKAVQIRFQVPDHLKEAFRFSAGQYITLKTVLGGEEVRRAYSLCSSPEEKELAVGVKEVPNGLFSSFANHQLSVGHSLDVSEPEGRFLFEKGAANTLMGVAAGSGITPLLSISKTALLQGSKVVLLFGNKTKEDTMFSSELKELERLYPEQFFPYYIYSQESAENSRFGRIDSGLLKWVIKQHPSFSFERFYLCGPEPLIDMSKSTLLEVGFPQEAVLFELFSSSSEAENSSAAVAEGMVNYTVLLDGESSSFTTDNKHLLLDAVLAENIDAPYSCQGGICSSCIARVTKGKAEMVKNQILTDGEVAEGLILTCQAKVLTSEITVDYDDV